ncbi:Nesprin-1 [Cichlidogyrus casuarinus]|uniref:Nesprin-1 n=1 Tax=Cichlidogyrus casuarinus TaxID=1844966 RepID=A0ABD2PW50_9PLAT
MLRSSKHHPISADCMPRELIDRGLVAHSSREMSPRDFPNQCPLLASSLPPLSNKPFPAVRRRREIRSCERSEEELRFSRLEDRIRVKSLPYLTPKRLRLSPSYVNSCEESLSLEFTEVEELWQDNPISRVSPQRELCETESRMQRVKGELSRVAADPPVKITNLFQDIGDGILLLRILELLSGEKLATEIRPQMQRIHCVSNVRTALEFLHSKNIKLVNINPTDIVDGKPTIVLGLIWTIILYFQSVSTGPVHLGDSSRVRSDAIAHQSRSLKLHRTRAPQATVIETHYFCSKYDLEIKDFGASWRDGLAFNAMVHNINPDLVDFTQLRKHSNRENLETAFDNAEKHLGIPRLLDPEDVDVERPDEKSIMTYVAQFFKSYPEGGNGGPKVSV